MNQRINSIGASGSRGCWAKPLMLRRAGEVPQPYHSAQKASENNGMAAEVSIIKVTGHSMSISASGADPFFRSERPGVVAWPAGPSGIVELAAAPAGQGRPRRRQEGHPPSRAQEGGTPPEGRALKFEGTRGEIQAPPTGTNAAAEKNSASVPEANAAETSGEAVDPVRRGTGGRCRECGGKGSGYLGITLCRRCRRERGIERDAAVRRLRAEGTPAPRIANQLGVPLGTVLRAIYRADRPLPLSTAERWQAHQDRLTELWRGLGLAIQTAEGSPR